MSINKRIKSLLKNRRYSNSAFEKMNGLANGTIRKITIEENFNPSYKVILAFAQTFPDLNLRWLITGEGSEESGNANGESKSTYQLQINKLNDLIEEATLNRSEIEKRVEALDREIEKVRKRVKRIERP